MGIVNIQMNAIDAIFFPSLLSCLKLILPIPSDMFYKNPTLECFVHSTCCVQQLVTEITLIFFHWFLFLFFNAGNEW